MLVAGAFVTLPVTASITLQVISYYTELFLTLLILHVWTAHGHVLSSSVKTFTGRVMVITKQQK